MLCDWVVLGKQVAPAEAHCLPADSRSRERKPSGFLSGVPLPRVLAARSGFPEFVTASGLGAKSDHGPGVLSVPTQGAEVPACRAVAGGGGGGLRMVWGSPGAYPGSAPLYGLILGEN